MIAYIDTGIRIYIYIFPRQKFPKERFQIFVKDCSITLTTNMFFFFFLFFLIWENGAHAHSDSSPGADADVLACICVRFGELPVTTAALCCAAKHCCKC